MPMGGGGGGKVADEKGAMEDSIKDFRRSSIDAGQTDKGLLLEDLRRYSLKEVANLTEANFEEVAESFLDLVKGTGGNLGVLKNMLPDGSKLVRGILTVLAPKIRPSMKD
mmetsp:Transcript_17587/g.36433  ORF Transcript_17587/g.36433 Transcript_17587/m.36433 type:complete len:110 (+) Transcript_17587:143-472(+)